MLKLSVPNKNQLLVTKRVNNLFYVSSETKGDAPKDRHMVVQHGSLFLCDCRDFFIRRLPLLGTYEFELCKHGKFVKAVTDIVPDGHELVGAVKT